MGSPPLYSLHFPQTLLDLAGPKPDIVFKDWLHQYQIELHLQPATYTSPNMYTSSNMYTSPNMHPNGMKFYLLMLFVGDYSTSLYCPNGVMDGGPNKCITFSLESVL